MPDVCARALDVDLAALAVEVVGRGSFVARGRPALRFVGGCDRGGFDWVVALAPFGYFFFAHLGGGAGALEWDAVVDRGAGFGGGGGFALAEGRGVEFGDLVVRHDEPQFGGRAFDELLGFRGGKPLGWNVFPQFDFVGSPRGPDPIDPVRTLACDPESSRRVGDVFHFLVFHARCCRQGIVRHHAGCRRLDQFMAAGEPERVFRPCRDTARRESADRRRRVFGDDAGRRALVDRVRSPVGEPDVPVGPYGDVSWSFGFGLGHGIFGDHPCGCDLAEVVRPQRGEPEVPVGTQDDVFRQGPYPKRVQSDRARG